MRRASWKDGIGSALAMKRESIFRAVNFSVNVFLISSLLLSLLGLGWEYSTRLYLAGFSNAVLPYSTTPEQNVAAILAWMEQGPARQSEYYSDDAENRDPIDTLNYKELLRVCGTATNAFVNLASAGGMQARRLLLLDAQGMNTNHVVAEVRINRRWVVVDPTYHAILTDSKGHPLTSQELAQPLAFQDATRKLDHYNPAYNYEHTAFIHFARLPVIGPFLQTKLNSVVPSWLDRINWTVLVERQSYNTLVVGIGLLCLAIFLRRLVFGYGHKLGIAATSPWEQLRHGGVALFSTTPVGSSDKSLSAMWH